MVYILVKNTVLIFKRTEFF